MLNWLMTRFENPARRIIIELFRNRVSEKNLEELLEPHDSQSTISNYYDIVFLQFRILNNSTIYDSLTFEELSTLFVTTNTIIAKVVCEYGGFIQYNDNLKATALFGAPVVLENSVNAACQAAIQIKKELNNITPLWPDYNHPNEFNMAIHKDNVIFGDFGSEKIPMFCAVGHAVEVLPRLIHLAVQNNKDIVITDSAAKDSTIDLGISNITKDFPIKGTSEPLSVYELINNI